MNLMQIFAEGGVVPVGAPPRHLPDQREIGGNFTDLMTKLN